LTPTTEKYRIDILSKLFYHKYIKGRHTDADTVLRNFKDGKMAKKAMRGLIKDNLILTHPTSYGQRISINPERLNEIKKLISLD